MKKIFLSIYTKHTNFWTKRHLIPLFQSFALFGVALVIQKFADSYVGQVKGVVVPDIILDHIPTVDIDLLIIQGALILTGIILCLVITKPKYFIFTVECFSIFIIVRSISISLTHLGVSPRQLPLDTNSFGFSLYNWLFNSKGDFFFSGHTGAPYLMALIFWQEKFWRNVFIAIAIIFGASVLLAHIHYSIDVVAAPFMTYGIFVISQKFFAKDFALTELKE